MKIKIGIPKCLAYYRYSTLYRKFFNYLGCDVIISEDASSDIVDIGKAFNRNWCFVSNIFIGQIFSLTNKCDYIFLPRYINYGKKDKVCCYYKEIVNYIRSMFVNVRVLSFDVDYHNSKMELFGFIKVGLMLRRGLCRSILAYVRAKKKEKEVCNNLIKVQENKINKENKKVLLLGYSYIILDNYLCGELIKDINRMNFTILQANYINKVISKSYYKDTVSYLDSLYDKELIGAISYLENVISGIIYVSVSDCPIYNVINKVIREKNLRVPVLSINVPDYDKKYLEYFLESI